MKPAITIEALPAAYGDALLISCPVGERTWRMLIDTGPDDSWAAVRARLAQLPVDREGHRHFDIVVVTHIDHDHIGAAGQLFTDPDLSITCGDVWFNARRHLERGVAEGEALGALLGAPNGMLPWNEAFNGGAVSTRGDGGFLEVPGSAGHPKLTLLSPTPKRLMRLASVWDEELSRLRQKRSNSTPESERDSEFPNLQALAARKPSKDRAIPNGSSIALLIEHQGASALLAADAFPTVLGSALLSLAQHRGTRLPLEVGAFKLSHHGSRANLLVELLECVTSRNFIISTNNAKFGHPNDETLARVILHSGGGPMLWFNYATDANLRWNDAELQERHSFRAWYPPNENQGATIELAPA